VGSETSSKPASETNVWSEEVNERKLLDVEGSNVKGMFVKTGDNMAVGDEPKDANVKMISVSDKHDAIQLTITTRARSSEICFAQCKRTQWYSNRLNSAARSLNVAPANRRIK
jgi:hypothetical protein